MEYKWLGCSAAYEHNHLMHCAIWCPLGQKNLDFTTNEQDQSQAKAFLPIVNERFDVIINYMIIS